MVIESLQQQNVFKQRKLFANFAKMTRLTVLLETSTYIVIIAGKRQKSKP